jgi:DNA-binding CsgD family transcriptional regulator
MPAKTQRDREILQLYLDGDSLADIGRAYGLTRSRAWQIVRAHLREHSERSRGPLPGRAVRAPDWRAAVTAHLAELPGLDASRAIVEEWLDGHGPQAIARARGLSRQRVLRIVSRWLQNQPGRASGNGRAGRRCRAMSSEALRLDMLLLGEAP